MDFWVALDRDMNKFKFFGIIEFLRTCLLMDGEESGGGGLVDEAESEVEILNEKNNQSLV